MNNQFTGRNKQTETLNGFITAMAIVGLSSLPYFHDIISSWEGGLKSWVPNLGVQRVLTDSEGYILGYSSYRVFLFIFLLHLFFVIVWYGWLRTAKRKPYYYALFIPVVLSLYQVLIILLDLRKTFLNDATTKGWLLIGLMFLSGFKFLRKSEFSSRVLLQWLAIIVIGILPFLHDIITLRGVGVKAWVPNFGIEDMLTNSEGKVLGFNNYRIFIYDFSLHLFAHLGVLGWFIDAWAKKYRPWILIPVSLTLYQLLIILFDASYSPFNVPSVKFYISIGLSVLLAINYFFNNKVESPKNQSV